MSKKKIITTTTGRIRSARRKNAPIIKSIAETKRAIKKSKGK